MKDTAILILIACIFVALSIVQITVTTTDTVAVTIRENEKASSVEALQTSSTVGNQLININTASEDLLCEIPGIGETKASKIIEYREQNGNFKSVEELLNVNGIGEATLEKMRPYITVD